MPRKRKSFTELSSRQKRRRLITVKLIDSRNGASSPEELSTNRNNSDRSPNNDALPIVTSKYPDRSPSNSSGSSPCLDNESMSNSSSTIKETSSNDSSRSFSLLHCDNQDEITDNFSNVHYSAENCTHLIETSLSTWIKREKKVSHESVNRLLVELRNNFPSLPKSVKTLLKYDREQNIVQPMDRGEYIHFPNWLTGIMKLINQNTNCVKVVDLLVNIDGIPLFNNTIKYTAYPLLVKAMNFSDDHIFCVGIYCSNKVNHTGFPDSSKLLEAFFSDIESPLDTAHGSVKLNLKAFCCDAPVRASLKNIVSHSGYGSCERCTQHGEYHGSVVYPRVTDTLRTDESFNNRTHQIHHKGDSPLELINFPMVSGFILDYMHSVCIGTMKRILLRLTTFNKRGKNVNLSTKMKADLQVNLDEIQQHIPSDFNRTLDGGIKNLCHWKASEHRLFLCYIGFVLLANEELIAPELYQNYLKFAIAMKFFLSDDQTVNLELMDSLMKDFVSSSSILYGKSFVSYNVHCMIHLIDDYKVYGNLNLVSCFCFESYLGVHVKGAVRNGFKPLQQIIPHITRQNMNISEPRERKFNPSRSMKCSHVNKSVHCFRQLTMPIGSSIKISISDKTSDSCIQLKGGDIAILMGIHLSERKIKLLVSLFHTKVSFFDSPIKSDSIGIYLVSKLTTPKWVSSKNIFGKMMLLPNRKTLGSFVALLMPHTVV